MNASKALTTLAIIAFGALTINAAPAASGVHPSPCTHWIYDGSDFEGGRFVPGNCSANSGSASKRTYAHENEPAHSSDETTTASVQPVQSKRPPAVDASEPTRPRSRARRSVPAHE